VPPLITTAPSPTIFLPPELSVKIDIRFIYRVFSQL
jgi:hypothetical protein